MAHHLGRRNDLTTFLVAFEVPDDNVMAKAHPGSGTAITSDGQCPDWPEPGHHAANFAAGGNVPNPNRAILASRNYPGAIARKPGGNHRAQMAGQFRSEEH